MIIFVLLFVGAVSGESSVIFNLKNHFKNLDKIRHPFYQDGVPWLESRKYIREQMFQYGAVKIEHQKFNTSVSGELIEGENIIGILEGSQPNEQIIVIGADYSTARYGNYLKENTGGVAVLLETIHYFYHYTRWDSYHQNFTVIFVAFDLNTKEFSGSGMGPSGAYHFVHNWLVPYLKTHDPNFKDIVTPANNGEPDYIIPPENHGSHDSSEADYINPPKKNDNGNSVDPDYITPEQPGTFSNFLGAIILDSVTTYNRFNETQRLRFGFEKAMPQAAEDILNSGKKGNFLGFAYTDVEKGNAIRQNFVENYNAQKILYPFRLQEMHVKLRDSEVISSEVMDLINKQSHYYFWTHSLEGIDLPAFLLFDTGNERTDPTPNVCPVQLDSVCDINYFLNNDRVAFMEKTTTTLMQTLLRLQATHSDDPHNGSSSSTNHITSLLCSVLFLFVSFLLKY